jgi:IclR family acetate operon transcriptional repressor
MVKTRASAAAPVGVISKVLRLLEAIQSAPQGLGLKAISELTGIHKSTAHRFLKHLEREGYLICTNDSAYLLGPRFWQMTTHINHRATLQAVARPILWDLWRATRETVNMAVLDQGTVLYVDVIESPHEFRLASRVGTRRPLHATALGKVLTAFLPDEQKKNVLGTITFQPSTSKTIMNLVQFRQELDKVAQQGYAVDDEEAVAGARCVSAPVLEASGEPVAAVSVSGPTTRISPGQVAVLAEAVTSAAEAISAAIGFSQSPARRIRPQRTTQGRR